MIGRRLEHEGRELTESQTDGLRHAEADWLPSGFKSPDVFGRTAVRGLGGPLALAALSKGAMDSESMKEGGRGFLHFPFAVEGERGA